MPAEKRRGTTSRNMLVVSKIWKNEELPKEWEDKAIIIPPHNNDDRLNCNNYRRISLLYTAYKMSVFKDIIRKITTLCKWIYKKSISADFKKGNYILHIL